MKGTQILPHAMHLLVFVALSSAQITNATLVNAQPGESAWILASKIGSVFDETTPIALSDDDAVGGVITIDTAASYYLKENITSQVVIDEDNVCLDMNCRSATLDATTDHIITINSGKKNIKIHDGALYSSTSPAIGCGILIESGASCIHVQNVKISDCGNGLRLNGSDGSEVIQCEIIALDLVGNTTGVVLNHADKNRFEDCCAADNKQAGFELLHSEINCFDGCNALTTQGNTTVAGFSSTSGRGNLFQNCVIKDTKTSAFEFCNKAYGFLLTGTEEKTKIIDCIINETDVTSTVSAIAYGIHLNPVLLKGDELLIEIDDDNTAGSIPVEVAWSPNGNYIAIGDVSRQVRVFHFDGSDLTQIANNPAPTDIVNFVAWSPDGKHIASGDSGDILRVFSFDGSTLTQIASNLTPSGNVNSVAWSPSGKYLATGESDGEVRVFSFDNVALTQVDFDSTSTGNTTSVTWSPDGNYIASGDTESQLHVFSFDGSAITYIDSDPTSGNRIFSVVWSPVGNYIATGDNGSSVRIFSFDGLELAHIVDQTTPPGGPVNSVSWSPNGKYITSGDSSNFVQVFGFDGLTLTPIAGDNTPGQTVWCIAWSPDGKYIVGGYNDNYLRVFTAMFGPENCLIKGNTICDTAAFGQFVGTGIATGGNNCVIKNCAYNNEVNYSYGIPHVYYANQNDTIRPFDNSSTPPF